MKLLVTGSLLCAVSAAALEAQTLTTLVNFDGQNGGQPDNALVQATDGNLYGTTSHGGGQAGGTIFRINPAGQLTTLYSFCSQAQCADGNSPDAPLVQGANGDLYGATLVGGDSTGCGTGCGVIFKITLSGIESTVYTFCHAGPPCIDGDAPYGLVLAGDGSLYGTTGYGGAGSDCENGCGTLFRITEDGTLTTLHTFTLEEGSDPRAALIQTANGDLYGTATGGGHSGSGSVFKSTPAGDVTPLHIFCSEIYCVDGKFPSGSLVQAADGNLYGITGFGGRYGVGTVFRITPGGSLTTLHNFCAKGPPLCDDGSAYLPYSALVRATDGNLYGTTQSGGTGKVGTIFKITLDGTLTTIFDFCVGGHCTDGNDPLGGMMQAPDGSFYGTTYGGGTGAVGTVFGLSMGLGPFVQIQPAFGPVGAPVRILGTDLTGASGVTFNGIPAHFKVSSGAPVTEITTIVPAGATTGEVQVVTPGGTLSSNVPFQVLP